MYLQTTTNQATSQPAPGAQTVPTTHSLQEFVPIKAQTAALAVISIALVFAIVFYALRFRKFARTYANLAARMDRQFGTRSEDAISPGHTYAVASRGPNHARDAEMQSAEVRWRHLSMAFPHLDDRGEKRPLILVSCQYTNVHEVNEMQTFLRARIAGHLNERGREIVIPDWITALGENFDALRHPELAIATPAIYTFPFFLTWQRRHQWGVLPYAVHTRLGVICHPEHTHAALLKQIEKEYEAELARAQTEQAAFWVNDPKHARWLHVLLEDAGKSPSTVDIVCSEGAELAKQHSSPTVFAVGAYLHKEILPLMCTILPTPRTGANYAERARQIEVSNLHTGFLPSDFGEWPKNSAVIADLAVLPENLGKSDWLVTRLPHCVYVPIGIGYSVATVPLLVEDRDFRDGLLKDVGEALTPASKALADIGIELDRRFWLAGRTDGSLTR